MSCCFCSSNPPTPLCYISKHKQTNFNTKKALGARILKMYVNADVMKLIVRLFCSLENITPECVIERLENFHDTTHTNRNMIPLLFREIHEHFVTLEDSYYYIKVLQRTPSGNLKGIFYLDKPKSLRVFWYSR